MDLTIITSLASVITVANYFFYKLYMFRTTHLEKKIEKLENHISSLDSKIDKLTERVARLEVVINNKLINKGTER